MYGGLSGSNSAAKFREQASTRMFICGFSGEYREYQKHEKEAKEAKAKEAKEASVDI